MRIAKEVLHCGYLEAKARLTMGEFHDWLSFFALEYEETKKAAKG